MPEITPQVPIVQMKSIWSENWANCPTLRPGSVVSALQPTIGTGTFEVIYGEINGGIYEPWRTWQDVFVQVLLSPTAEELRFDPTTKGTPIWRGVITGKVDKNQRTLDRGAGEEIRYVASGKETLVARDLTYLLDRVAITGSYMEDTFEDDTGVNLVDRVYPFNLTADRGMPAHNNAVPQSALAGNRSAIRYTNPATGLESYVFSDAGSTWSLANIIEYLLAWWASDRVTIYGPNHLTDPPGPYTGVMSGLDKIEQTVEPRCTVRETLNSIIPRSRGLAWCVDNGDPPALVIRSVIAEDIEADGMVIPGNTTRHVIDGDSASLAQIEIQQATEHEYDRIAVRGAMIVTVATVAGASAGGHLIPAWCASMESSYKNADIDGRATDEMGRVWTTLKVDPDQGRAVLGLGNGYGPPVVDDDGSVLHYESGPILRTGQTFLRQLPLLKGTDYTNYANPIVVDPEAPAGDFLPPMVWVKCDVGGVGSAGYYLVDQPVEIGTEKLRPPGSSVRMLDGDLGFQIGVRPGHRLALNHWADADGPDLADQVFDYDDIVATVALAGPSRISVIEDLPRGEDRDDKRVLVIDVPDAEYWWIMDDTILGWINTGVEPSAIRAKTTILRDDRTILRRVAAAARAWYGRTRRQIRLGYQELVGQFLPGDLVERLTMENRDPIEVATVISTVVYEFNAATTVIATDFRELEFTGRDLRSGGGGARAAQSALSRDPKANLPVRDAKADGTSEIRCGVAAGDAARSDNCAWYLGDPCFAYVKSGDPDNPVAPADITPATTDDYIKVEFLGTSPDSTTHPKVRKGDVVLYRRQGDRCIAVTEYTASAIGTPIFYWHPDMTPDDPEEGWYWLADAVGRDKVSTAVGQTPTTITGDDIRQTLFAFAGDGEHDSPPIAEGAESPIKHDQGEVAIGLNDWEEVAAAHKTWMAYFAAAQRWW